MHEYAVTKSIVSIVLEEAQKVGAQRVSEVRLAIGDLSTIIDESVQMYFDIISEGTIAQGAKLVFRRIPAQFKCKLCANIFNKPATGFECNKCGGMGFPTGVGKEFYVESLEID